MLIGIRYAASRRAPRGRVVNPVGPTSATPMVSRPSRARELKQVAAGDDYAVVSRPSRARN